MAVTQMQARKVINTFDFCRVRERMIEEGKLSLETIDEAISEFRKFMILAANGAPAVMCSDEVDEVWHTFILFTRDYEAFCRRVFGGFFHHQPVNDQNIISKGDINRFFEAYTAEFGYISRLWSNKLAGCDGRCSNPPNGPHGPACKGAPPPPTKPGIANTSMLDI